jgi:hypothetical protein
MCLRWKTPCESVQKNGEWLRYEVAYVSRPHSSSAIKQYTPLHFRICMVAYQQGVFIMRILSIFIIYALVMQGAVFGAPQCRSVSSSQCPCCEHTSQKCNCCTAEVPKNAGRTSQKNVPLNTSPCNCTAPAAPQRHETAAFISENSGFDPVRFLSAVPVVTTWHGFNYLRTSVAAAPLPRHVFCSRVFCPLRI